MRFVHDNLPQRVCFGTGQAAEYLQGEIGGLGASRVMVIASNRDSQLVAAITDGLPVALRHDEVVMHVPLEVAERARAAASRVRADAVVSIGGGSATGLAKAVALTTGLPVIAVPTTYAGSEATAVWGLTEGSVKTTGTDPKVLPRTIVYDASLTLSLPVDMSVASGLNALAHCVDALWAPKADPISAAFATEGIRALNTGLPRVAADPGDVAGREETLYASYLAAAAFASAGSALHHKICHVLGGKYNLPHAQTHATVLPYVLAFNGPAAREAMGRIAGAFGSKGALEGLQRLRAALDAPRALADYGFAEGDIAAAAAAILPAVPPSNPRAVTAADLEALLRAAWSGAEPRLSVSPPVIGMKRNKIHLSFPQRAVMGTMRNARWWFAAVAVIAVIIVAAGAGAYVRLSAPPPALSMTMNWVTAQQQPATASIEWPAVRESAVTVSGFRQTWETGGQQEVPIASITKMMTAYLILKDHPLSGDEQGPSITITPSDVAAYQAGIANEDSSVKITDGETITERQALEALLLPSADDIAWVLAAWDAGSNSAFTAKMNKQARALGMDHTDYTDPSGLSSSTVSTAHDQLILERQAMAIPAFASIVAMQTAQIPVQGTIQNYNPDTGEDGIVGVKTGSTSEARGCWAFAVRRDVAGTERTVYGVVLGAPGNLSTMVPAALDDGVDLADDVSRTAAKKVTVLPAGTVVGHITVPWSKAQVPVVTTRALTGLAAAGSHVSVRTTSNDPGTSFTDGQRVGVITADGLISGTSSTPVVTKGASGKPSVTWRLFH